MNTKNQERKQEDYVYTYTTEISQLEEENKLLRSTVINLKEELDRFRRNPLLLCEVRDVIGEEVLIRLSNGNEFMVNKSKDIKNLRPGDHVLCEQKNLTIIKKIKSSKSFNVEKFVIIEKPKLSWKEVGGLKETITELKEVIELPLKKPQLFNKVGITPPKGVLLYGPPGTGKTLLAKVVAASTNSTFIEIVASELVQKFIGEGAKLVKEVFELAREKAPSIVFIDELDALAARRIEIGTSGEREVQRTFMQFLAEIDGFKPLSNVKIIGCTNRIDILDPAVTRPGRLDRLIKVDLPDKEGIKQIFEIHTKNMKLSKRINKEKLYKLMEKEAMSGAEIKAVCTEAGYFAIRKGKTQITESDFIKAIEKVKRADTEDVQQYRSMFG